MLLFFICWLYLIPSLLFPLAEQGGSSSHPNLNHFFLCLELVLIYMAAERCGAAPLSPEYLCEFCLEFSGIAFALLARLCSLFGSRWRFCFLCECSQINHYSRGLWDDEASSEEERVVHLFSCTSFAACRAGFPVYLKQNLMIVLDWWRWLTAPARG